MNIVARARPSIARASARVGPGLATPLVPWSVISVFNDLDYCYWAWSCLFNEICDRHAPFREVKIRQQSLPWIMPQIRDLMNLHYKTLLKAKRLNNQELWWEYRVLRNRVTHKARVAESNCYTNLLYLRLLR